MKVYLTKGSGNAYKVTLLCSLIGVKCEGVEVDYANGANKKEPYLSINPRGQVPALEDNGRVFWDSNACLVYVARKYGGEKWLPSDPADMAEVMQWVALALNEIQFGLQYARGIVRKIRTGNYEECAALGRKGLDVLERRLARNDWLALGRPTIADVTNYPYVQRAPEGNIPLDPYPAVQAWLKRVEALPGYFAN